MKVSYNHLLKYIPSKPSIDDISNKLFQLGHEHEIDNNIFDMELTPNRGDCLSIDGLLRDLAVFYKINLNKKTYQDNIDNLKLEFENNAHDSCPSISFLRIEIESNIEEYSGSLASYFSELGVPKNNFFTDISNYISYETGQPTHCYDASKMVGSITLDTLDTNTEFKTLTGKTIELSSNDLVFKKNGRVINLAGIMGGEDTSCSSDTRSVIVECAYFNPEHIIGKSVKYDISSDAAYKFERGVDIACHEYVLRRFLYIVKKHATIKKVQLLEQEYKDKTAHNIECNFNKINRILGTNIEKSTMQNYLYKLGFNMNDNRLTIPSYRNDIKTENDVAEEIARAIGYDNILENAIEIPDIQNKKISNNQYTFGLEIKKTLIKNGFYEVINYPFINHRIKESVVVDNPIDSNKKYLRTNLKESLIHNLLYNERRQKDSVKLFELSDVYYGNKKIESKKMFGIICSGRVNKNYIDFSKKIDKKYLEELLKPLEIDVDKISTIERKNLDTKLTNTIVYLEFEIDNWRESNENSFVINDRSKIYPINFIKYNPVSDYPSSHRDLSFSVKNEKSFYSLQNSILNYENVLIKEIFIFDFYNNQKNNEIKIGFRFIFQSDTTTLTDIQINEIVDEIITLGLSIDFVELPGLS